MLSAEISSTPRQSSGVELELALSLKEVFHQRLVETDARIHRHIIDVGVGAFSAIKLAKLLDRAEIIRTHSLGIDRQLVRCLHVLELDQTFKGKIHFRFIE